MCLHSMYAEASSYFTAYRVLSMHLNISLRRAHLRMNYQVLMPYRKSSGSCWKSPRSALEPKHLRNVQGNNEWNFGTPTRNTDNETRRMPTGYRSQMQCTNLAENNECRTISDVRAIIAQKGLHLEIGCIRVCFHVETIDG